MEYELYFELWIEFNQGKNIKRRKKKKNICRGLEGRDTFQNTKENQRSLNRDYAR